MISARVTVTSYKGDPSSVSLLLLIFPTTEEQCLDEEKKLLEDFLPRTDCRHNKSCQRSR